MSDRRVHAVLVDDTEIVRYDRSGKWYVEPRKGKRRGVSVREAARQAGSVGTVYLGLPGGSTFDRIVVKARP